ncbi:uroporphyrinogen-III synthase [Flavobacteriaceae bacterium]|nr:uroporphyrinogen-III synthase [Flavobacteriaceae bacterium]MDB4643484.1 uroporphyrinogen-III synthase [Flavobacteriaceae bacterium]MDB4714816.1 uroporphyrinogen-III synthase [Flavobacteriaceae bacterium]MDB4773331.1 uroporphyrinogen-III synthase [Flavobacteriaceae bacterium]
MKSVLKILSTKTLSKTQKSRIIELGHAYTERNFIETKTVPFSYEENNSTLLFSSQNAVKSVYSKPGINTILKDKKCYCVGEKTKNLLLEKGLKVTHFEENSSDLAYFITKKAKNERFLFFCGNERRPELETILKKENIEIEATEVYQTILKPKKMGFFNVILFYSPSGVKSFLKHNSLDQSLCVCIGETTASSILIPKENILIAPKPTIEHMIYTIKKQLHTHD